MTDVTRSASEVVLASASSIRRQLLGNAGVRVRVSAANLDEKAYRAELAVKGIDEPAVIAMELAKAKAVSISRWERGCLVVGADQVLALGGETLSKAANVAAAKDVLMRLRGRKHSLHSGVAVARDGLVLWTALDTAVLQMRSYSENWIDDYLKDAGDAATKSVGAYQLEGVGIQMLERLEGDYFTILGLPLLPLLAFLRSEGVIGT